jgi:putative cardiolipin synthase
VPCFRWIAIRLAGALVLGGALAGCAGLPPGADYPRQSSVAQVSPEQTLLAAQFAARSAGHPGQSGFHLFAAGRDGFLIRLQMIDSAKTSLDLQYYIFRGDSTGRLLADALLRAADRGVRVRVLVDDGDTRAGDEQLYALDGHPGIEIRLYNPFRYRGHLGAGRAIEFLFNARRLDYRMHNKLMTVDNGLALMGGRNIGNEYFQVDPAAQVADDDILVAGPLVVQLSASFDEFWNSRFAIPTAALARHHTRSAAIAERRGQAEGRPTRIVTTSATDGVDYTTPIATGEPYAGIASGQLPLTWATAQVFMDSPDRQETLVRKHRRQVLMPAVVAALSQVQAQLLIITPYFVPDATEFTALTTLRDQDVTVRILTNSLWSSRDILPHSAYTRYRRRLLEHGIGLYELRANPGSAQGSGQSARLSRYGNYGLHAKLFVLDGKRIFVGSMNYDKRSRNLNTEIGLLIDSEVLANQSASRFVAMTLPENAYVLSLRGDAAHGGERITWSTTMDGVPVETTTEPSPSAWLRRASQFVSRLPISGEL